MVIAGRKDNDGETLFIGLSKENLKRLQQGKPVRVSRASHGLAVPAGLLLVIDYGETEQAIAESWAAIGLLDAAAVRRQFPDALPEDA